MSLEILAITATKTSRLDGAGGGRDTLRPEDVALALAGLSERVFLYGLYTVVNDRSVQARLVYYAHLEVVDLAIARGWRPPKGSVFRKMAILALCEVQGVSCGTCERRRTISDENGVAVACPACGGSGLRRFTAREREEALGVSGGRWLARYERAYRRISGWQTTLEDHLRRRLRPYDFIESAQLSGPQRGPSAAAESPYCPPLPNPLPSSPAPRRGGGQEGSWIDSGEDWVGAPPPLAVAV
ncbi:MAG: hypothetical protein ACREXW_00900 [Gammaproteobacteria bacterium]